VQPLALLHRGALALIGVVRPYLRDRCLSGARGRKLGRVGDDVERLARVLRATGELVLAAPPAPPDVLWELEDQLGLPGRVVIEPLIRRFLPIVLLVIAFGSGLRASGRWQTALGYLNAVPFGTADPVFGRDLAFFVFQLPFWRMVLGWGTTLVLPTLVLTLAIYILQRSLVLTTRGPRLAAGARSHLLVLGAVLVHSTKASAIRIAAAMDHVIEAPPDAVVEAESTGDVARGSVLFLIHR